jgi:hypothetical protein
MASPVIYFTAFFPLLNQALFSKLHRGKLSAINRPANRVGMHAYQFGGFFDPDGDFVRVVHLFLK